MRNKDVIRSLRQNCSVNISPAMIRNCIAGLPEVRSRNSMLPLLKLQVSYFPKWIYLVIGMMFWIVSVMTEQCSALQMVLWSGRMLQGIAIILGVHLLMAGWNEMWELECSCKYQYSQIYLSRIIIGLCCLFLFCAGLNILFIIQFGSTKVIWNVLILFPLVLGAVCALAITHLFHLKNDVIPFGILIVISIVAHLVIYEWRNYMEQFAIYLVAIFILLALLMLVQAWHMMGRRLIYETYNM